MASVLTQEWNLSVKSRKFNFDWKFQKGDYSDASNIQFDDSDWRTLDLPHDWSIEGPFKQEYASSTGYLPGGIGWYRKKFSVPDSLKGKKVFIQFDGIYKNSEVWVNEQYLGKRPYGYSSFHYDLTPYLNFGDEENVIAVKVDHTDFADSRWYTGSGIYRNVFINLTEQVYIKPYGVFITPPNISASEAEIRIQTSIRNEFGHEAEIQIQHHIKNAEGKEVISCSSAEIIPAQGELDCSHTIFLEKPTLWSPETPYLYQVETKVIKDGEVISFETTPFGVRHFHFDADSGFYLNGKSYKMKGVCIHHDAGCLGAAVPEKVWHRRLQLLKDAGVNAIRMSHNPPAPELLDMCDSYGFLVQDEAFDEWEHPKNKWVEGWNKGQPALDGYASDFSEWAEIDLRDMILRDRNHPSIIFWSIGNEIDYPNDPYSHPVLEDRYKADKPEAKGMGGIAKRLAKVVKQYDPTRPVTAALASARMSNETEFPDALDVVGYNYQELRYAEDHERYPKRVIYGSENGRHHDAWLAVEHNDFISGQFIWTGIDYLGEARGWPLRHATPGMLDLAGFKKPLYFFKQSEWSNEDMVYAGLTSLKANSPEKINWDHEVVSKWEGTEGEIVRVACCTNCPEVDLILNGESVGVKKREDFPGGTIYWDIPYSEGTLKAAGIRNGVICCTHELKTAGAPAKVCLTPDINVLKADKQDVAHIEVNILDHDHNLVFDADHLIDCTIEGPGEIIGIECSNPASHQHYKATSRMAFHGKLLIYVKAADQPGTITLKASTAGLESASVIIEVE
ncbi:glycoside hydrolase family 2 TIM barrel-domain containing protein [Mesobacillus foraminis]|uniref:glycoside hydrolase family 2 TIM barrel-domain containing protein n=1 Tax=Mesobacillus foraminis TaxID=279826 RepID=UPI000EF4C365|nr:glycoside hydrolase family 2 TIM barrel-domain containing protein [Mesobacillus foraminis]